MRRILSLNAPSLAPSSEALAYNQAGSGYGAYADGDCYDEGADLLSFDSVHAYADRRVWMAIDDLLARRRSAGFDAVTILDAGCGPGAWLYRTVSRALALGFTRVRARGFDIAAEQVKLARARCDRLMHDPRVSLRIEVDDLIRPLKEADSSVDVSLCLYSVISHLPAATHSAVVAELGRVTSGHLVTTVRAVGSTPSAFVDSMERVRELRQDHRTERCEIEFSDGRHSVFGLHLFTAVEVRQRFEPTFDTEDLRGLDLFHGRFAPDSRWNPPGVGIDAQLDARLTALEDAFAADPAFIDHAAHLMLVGRRRAAG